MIYLQVICCMCCAQWSKLNWWAAYMFCMKLATQVSNCLLTLYVIPLHAFFFLFFLWNKLNYLFTINGLGNQWWLLQSYQPYLWGGLIARPLRVLRVLSSMIGSAIISASLSELASELSPPAVSYSDDK